MNGGYFMARGLVKVSVVHGSDVEFIESKKRKRNASVQQPLNFRPTNANPSRNRVSDVIELPSGDQFKGIHEAVMLIEQVHGVSDLSVAFAPYPLGQHTDAAYAPADTDSRPKSGFILYKQKTKISAMSFLEEFAHALDHQAFLDRPGYATDAGDSDIQPVIDAILASATYCRVASYRLGQSVSLHQNGRVVTELISVKKTLEYEQSQIEWFARAYVQFIAISSGDADLMRELATFYTSATYELLYPCAWPDDEFEPIAVALEGVLREKGWLK
jgi:hypothetical protein